MRAFVSLVAFSLGSCFVCAQYAQPMPRSAPLVQQPQQLSQDQQPEQGPPTYIALRIVGSHVHNPDGYRLGRIEEVLVNRTNGVTDYAVVAASFPTNDSRLVPLPWSMLTYAWDQSRAGGPAGANQIFIANIGPERLAKAPTLDRNRTSGIEPALAAANSYFGGAFGGTGSGSGTVGGAGSSQPPLVSPAGAATPATVAAPGVADGTATSGTQGQQPFYVVPGTAGGFAFVTTNGVVDAPTNANSTNAVGAPSLGGTNSPPATNSGVVFQPGSGPPFTPFPGSTRPNNVATNAVGPNAGISLPVERSQRAPRTPVESSQPSTTPGTGANR
jgi:hypothetical protein